MTFVMQAKARAEWLELEQGCKDGIATVIDNGTDISCGFLPAIRTCSLAVVGLLTQFGR